MLMDELSGWIIWMILDDLRSFFHDFRFWIIIDYITSSRNIMWRCLQRRFYWFYSIPYHGWISCSPFNEPFGVPQFISSFGQTRAHSIILPMLSQMISTISLTIMPHVKYCLFLQEFSLVNDAKMVTISYKYGSALWPLNGSSHI